MKDKPRRQTVLIVDDSVENIEVLGEIFSKGPATKTVFKEYGKLIRMFDSEFNLMLNVPVEEISQRYSPVLGKAVQRIRKGKVIRRAGFDGEFGVIKVFDEGELKELVGQSALFEKKKTKKKTDPLIKPSLFEYIPTCKETFPSVFLRQSTSDFPSPLKSPTE